jgi:hypothetical protein
MDFQNLNLYVAYMSYMVKILIAIIFLKSNIYEKNQ